MNLNRVKFFSIRTVVIVMMLLPALPLSAEHLFLKDGSIIKGKVVSETANEIIMQDEKYNITRYPHNNVMRVLYTDLNMGNIYVQMKTGKNFRAYMVDEDQNSYTFRYILFKPEEFIVKRSDVLFMAERNPSGLNGESSYFEISLNWFPPYDKMKYFNIYIKTNKDNKFIKADTSRTNSFQLKGLNSNTKYSIKVTGVDDTGTETLPSNEITVVTLNRAPFSPPELKMSPIKTGGTIIEWKPAVDPDGTVVKYRIYKIVKDRKEPAGETKETSFKISGKEAIDRIFVSAVDDMGAESETSGAYLNRKDVFSITITPAVIFPIGVFGTMGSAGFGGNISFMAQNLFWNGFTLGLEFGYFYTLGINSIMSTGQSVHYINLFTGALKTGYVFKANKFLSITPAVYIGAGYIDMTYTSRNQVFFTDTEKAARGFDFMAGASVSFDFNISENLFIGINAGFGSFFETSRTIQFITLGINLGARF